MPTFSELLKAALKNAGLRGYQLAELAGCAQSAVSDANTGKDAPRHEMAEKWADILKIHGRDRDAWLDAAAAQRARRADISGRTGERRLADRLSALEQQVCDLSAWQADITPRYQQALSLAKALLVRLGHACPHLTPALDALDRDLAGGRLPTEPTAAMLEVLGRLPPNGPTPPAPPATGGRKPPRTRSADA